MADHGTQSFASHARFHPMWHFVAVPIVGINLIVAAIGAFRDPSATTLWNAVLALGLGVAIFAARVQTLIVQDRLIRLEMRLRLRELLSAEMAKRIPELTVKQLVGLRFASDAELPGLVERCLKGELPDGTACKQAIKDWQPDFQRA
jgi:hypothetical protein